MIYLFFLFISCLYLKTLGQYKEANQVITITYCLPILFFWTVLIGGQYAVGTDFFNYMDIYNGDLYYIEETRKEYGFSYFIRFLNYFNLYGRSIFFIVSILWVLILFYIMKTGIQNKFFYIFFFVFIVFSGVFNNQLNGQRQYFAVYLLTFGYCLFLQDHKKWGLIIMILAGFVHTSAFIFLPFLLILSLLFIYLDNDRFLIIVLSISTILCFILNINIVDKILPLFSTYASYADSDYIQNRSIILKLTKLWYLPIFLLSIYKHHKFHLNKREELLFYMGILGFSMKIALLNIGLLSRMSQYLEIISCFPIVYFMVYLVINKKLKSQILVYSYLICPYIFKVLISPKNEYNYSFFLFQ